ncbi:MAG: S9 family peptidase [Alphaproteobacteria bacterium]|nr:S9 family peptidase [Alphaproteobacteria bacterium]
MRLLPLAALSAFALGLAGAFAAAPVKDNDPYLWLVDIHGAKALSWVKTQNAKSDTVLKNDPGYRRDYETLLAILNSNDRIPEPQIVDHQWVFNFWQDANHVRGLWRRTPTAEYATAAPHWQTLFDVDKYDRETGKNWVWQGTDCTPSFNRCLIALSPGGTDAHVVREFDPRTGQFIEGGFSLPEAKSQARYVDNNTILFATDFGPDSITTSSYPRIAKMWHRGEPVDRAKVVYEAKADDVGANLLVFRGPYGVVPLVQRQVTFFTADYFLVTADDTAKQLPIPRGAQMKGVTQGQLVFTLRDAWTPAGGKAIAKGSLVAFPVLAFAQTRKMQPAALLYTPGPRSMIEASVSAGRDAVYAPIYENVIGSIHEFRFANDKWTETMLPLPKQGSTQVVSTNDWGPDAYFTYQSFTQPPTLYHYAGTGAPKAIKSEPSRFDASNLSVTQNWATSRDGTQVPYFLIRPKDTKGPIPTILYSYGGFELSLNPWYWNDGHRPIYPGEPWFSKGGAIAVANIRGGGEFGPAWHQTALKEHRQRAFDDFAAVAMDLEQRKFSTPKQLGIVGASNGGVLTTVTMTQHPELLNAVVCQRPLVDMMRYTRFGAGQSWVEEYGDPANAPDRAWIAKYSAYQKVKAGEKYPSILFITETTDDRVTPIWARMMAAKMEAQKHDVLFYETAEGGHGGGVTHEAEAEYWAMSYTFFRQKLGLGSGDSTAAGSAHSAAPR